jgi:hypothetical protein
VKIIPFNSVSKEFDTWCGTRSFASKEDADERDKWFASCPAFKVIVRKPYYPSNVAYINDDSVVSKHEVEGFKGIYQNSFCILTYLHTYIILLALIEYLTTLVEDLVGSKGYTFLFKEKPEYSSHLPELSQCSEFINARIKELQQRPFLSKSRLEEFMIPPPHIIINNDENHINDRGHKRKLEELNNDDNTTTITNNPNNPNTSFVNGLIDVATHSGKKRKSLSENQLLVSRDLKMALGGFNSKSEAVFIRLEDGIIKDALYLHCVYKSSYMWIECVKGFTSDPIKFFTNIEKIPIDADKFDIKPNEVETSHIQRLFSLGFIFVYLKDEFGQYQHSSLRSLGSFQEQALMENNKMNRLDKNTKFELIFDSE